jgi:hypothetical protein
VAYFSKTMAPAECNYEIHDKEMLAIIRRAHARHSEAYEILMLQIVEMWGLSWETSAKTRVLRTFGWTPA